MTTVEVRFRIHNGDVAQPERRCVSMLTADEHHRFLTDGIVVPERRLTPATLTELTETVTARHGDQFTSPDQRTYTEDFAGQYVRDPHKIDPRVITLPLLDNPVADTARCLLGPRIAVRNSSIRVTQPGSGDATIWHTDYRPHTSPAPALPGPPAVITVLIYLDPADAGTGPLYVLPGSHLRAEQSNAGHDDLAGQRLVTVEPGQVVIMNAALWHRGGANVSPDRIRRLVTIQLAHVGLAPFNFDSTLPGPAWQRLVEKAKTSADEPLLELLGLGGVNPSSARY